MGREPLATGYPRAAPLADAIVVLSGGRHAAPGPERITEWHDPDRFLAGVELFQAGRAPRLLFTGGRNPFHPGLPPEGELYRREAMALGIAEQAMASTPPVRTRPRRPGRSGPCFGRPNTVCCW